MRSSRIVMVWPAHVIFEDIFLGNGSFKRLGGLHVITCSGTSQHTVERPWILGGAGSYHWGNAGQTRMECTPHCAPPHCCCCASTGDPAAGMSRHPQRTGILPGKTLLADSLMAHMGIRVQDDRGRTR